MATIPLLAAAWALQPGFQNGEIRILERFSALPAQEQVRLCADLESWILGQDHPLCRAARNLARSPTVAAAPRLAADPARAFDAEQFAPALGLKTVVWQAGDAPWRSLHRSYFGNRQPPPPPPDRWAWDPGRDALVAPLTPAGREQDLLAAMRGAWPPDRRQEVWALGALDTDRSRNPVADYFEHCYRNREGGVYAGIRLADTWDCGKTFEVSDVEAIAWLRTVAGDTTTVSPIPASRHDEIYRRIEDSFAAWREHWSLRRALAVRMLAPWQMPDSLFVGAVELLDTAWVLCDHDPARMNERLARDPGRDAFLVAVAADASAVRALELPPPAWTEGWAARESLAETLRAAAEEFLHDEGLLGLGTR